jgi:4-hydroxy-tetrahydrodipicolinate reductase
VVYVSQEVGKIMVKIGIVGCAGRMGRMLMQQVLETEGAILAGGTERAGADTVGMDLGLLAGSAPQGTVVSEDAAALFAACDAVIDFTTPQATVAHAKLAALHNTVLVVGTTGLTAAEQAEIDQAGQDTVIVQAPNMSVGVNLLFALTELVAAKLGIDYDIEIVEMHHRHKVDAPSGTALGLGQAAAKGRKVNLDDVADKVRDGVIGARKPGDIGFATLRGGDVVGDHTVCFATEGERIELTHKASSRAVFAKGAVRAAIWGARQQAGCYSMFDVLDLKV